MSPEEIAKAVSPTATLPTVQKRYAPNVYPFPPIREPPAEVPQESSKPAPPNGIWTSFKGRQARRWYSRSRLICRRPPRDTIMVTKRRANFLAACVPGASVCAFVPPPSRCIPRATHEDCFGCATPVGCRERRAGSRPLLNRMRRIDDSPQSERACAVCVYMCVCVFEFDVCVCNDCVRDLDRGSDIRLFG